MAKKKRLLIILGAGSSIQLSIPSVGDINSEMRSWSAKFSATHRTTDLFKYLWDTLTAYHEREPKVNLRQKPNFEAVLGEMVDLAAWLRPAPHGTSLREAVGYDRAVPPITWLSSVPYGAFVDINMLLTHLLMQLAQYIRTRSLRLYLGRSAPPFEQYRSIFETLKGDFDLAVYNLNYDAAAVLALPSAFTGFNTDGKFDAQAVHERREWNLAYHLHGSVYHTLNMAVGGGTLEWVPRLDAHHIDGYGVSSTQDQTENRSFPRTTLIAGGYKLDQLLNEPYQSMYASLVRHANEADAILVGGYGFGDLHVNRALQNRLSHETKRPPVAVLTWSGLDVDPRSRNPMEARRDPWSTLLRGALNLRGATFTEPGSHHPPDLDDLIARNAMEVAEDARVAIWHGGFLGASRVLDKLLKHLV